MTTLVPNSNQTSGAEVYEDMFKEITRKLYGEEAPNNLHTPATQIGPDVDRSFLLSDRNLTSTDFDSGVGIENSLKNDDHLTAFGLALMQNGFPTPILNSHTFQQISKQNQTNLTSLMSPQGQNTSANETTQEKCLNSQRANELITWSSKSENYQQSQKPYKPKKQDARENSIAVIETLKSANGQKSNSGGGNTQQTSNGNSQSMLQKRYNCTNCPYSTDRRDLFTRHENIHKEDKPFHCYVCLKQFNRADHCKKHFVRMHRGLNYDIGRTKRSQPQAKSKKINISGASYYNNANNSHQTNIPSTYHSTLHNQLMEQQPQNVEQSNQHLSNTFPASCGNAPNQQNQQNQSRQMSVKVEKNIEKSPKKGDKRFVCCYCSWSGNDNWGLKRHLNTHTKPFTCVLCDYKAARSERLATHVFKVHNKKVCTKCNYLAENQSEYDIHINDAHANESRAPRYNTVTNNLDGRSSASQASRNVNNNFHGNIPFNSEQTASNSNTFSGNWRSMIGGGTSLTKTNGNSNTNSKQKTGAERLFQYFEADDSDPEDYARQLQMAAMSRNTSSVALDFHNAGGGKISGANYTMSKPYDCKLNQYTETILSQNVPPPADQKNEIVYATKTRSLFDEHNKENRISKH